MTTIRLKIAPDGTVTLLDVEGAGQGCRDLTAALERRLGTPDEASRAATGSCNDLGLTISQEGGAP